MHFLQPLSLLTAAAAALPLETRQTSYGNGSDDEYSFVEVGARNTEVDSNASLVHSL